VLAIDIGGSHVKCRLEGSKTTARFVSGPDLTPGQMVEGVLEITRGWEYDVISIGYPGPVAKGRPLAEPHNLGCGWVGFHFAEAFHKPVRLVNDAAMQALGSYEGGRMLFLGLGTGLGSALIVDGVLIPMELAHLPYRKGRTYEDYMGQRGLDRLGKKKWRKHVGQAIECLRAALEPEYIVLGGGNVKKLNPLPPHCRPGDNTLAFKGGFRLWQQELLDPHRRHTSE
jgi:polyphosphate glucokinase